VLVLETRAIPYKHRAAPPFLGMDSAWKSRYVLSR
jgi:hypothetical protein